MTEPVLQLLDDAVARGVCSAAALAVGDGGREVLVHATGTTRIVPTPGEVIDADAVFDLASVTKVMSTSAIAIELVRRGKLHLEAAADAYVPGVDPRVTVLHLLGHGAGFPAHIKFYERIWRGDLAGESDPRRALVRMAATHPLERAPGEAVVYSDLGYITLGAALEAAGGAPLERLFAELIAQPLQLGARFVDLRGSREPFDAAVVATELCPVRGLVQGEVHDENCHAGGGVAGHAGLFANVRDVSRFGGFAVEQIATDAIARRFVETAAAPGDTRRLGWDTPSAEPGVSHAGDRWPREGAFGHTGFTGTSLWLDVPRRRWVALLTNRVHPSRERERAAEIKDLRRAVMDSVVTSLGG